MILENLIVYILCVIAGAIIVKLLHSIQTRVGTLIIDQSNPGKDVYRIEIDNLDDLSKKKRVILNVKVSQK